jgi:hypothetical protein
MSMFVFAVFLIGALFGMRFKVFVLIPAVAVVVSTIAWFGTLHGEGIYATLIWVALAWGALQIGYFCGIVMRYNTAQARTKRKASPEVNQPTRASWHS